MDNKIKIDPDQILTNVLDGLESITSAIQSNDVDLKDEDIEEINNELDQLTAVAKRLKVKFQ